ncbi:MAG: hypothetical protein ACM3X9_12585 [Bacillota bacterium]
MANRYQIEPQQVVVRTPAYESRIRALGDLLDDLKIKKDLR